MGPFAEGIVNLPFVSICRKLVAHINPNLSSNLVGYRIWRLIATYDWDSALKFYPLTIKFNSLYGAFIIKKNIVLVEGQCQAQN